jgi:hypothetical protein
VANLAALPHPEALETTEIDDIADDEIDDVVDEAIDDVTDGVIDDVVDEAVDGLPASLPPPQAASVVRSSTAHRFLIFFPQLFITYYLFWMQDHKV